MPVTPSPISCMFALPTSSAPAARKRATGVASARAGRVPKIRVPAAVGYGTWSSSSLTATGTPSSHDSGAPRRQRSAEARACRRTSSSSQLMIARSGGGVVVRVADGARDRLGHRLRTAASLLVGPRGSRRWWRALRSFDRSRTGRGRARSGKGATGARLGVGLRPGQEGGRGLAAAAAEAGDAHVGHQLGGQQPQEEPDLQQPGEQAQRRAGQSRSLHRQKVVTHTPEYHVLWRQRIPWSVGPWEGPTPPATDSGEQSPPPSTRSGRRGADPLPWIRSRR